MEPCSRQVPDHADRERGEEHGSLLSEERRPGLVGHESEHSGSAHDVCIRVTGSQSEREREPGGDRGEQMPGVERWVRRDLTDRPEPVECDRTADFDSEDEPEELDERARGVRNARLEMLARELSHPDRQRHPGEEGDECGECHEIR